MDTIARRTIEELTAEKVSLLRKIAKLEVQIEKIRAYIEENDGCDDDLQCYKVANRLREILGDEA